MFFADLKMATDEGSLSEMAHYSPFDCFHCFQKIKLSKTVSYICIFKSEDLEWIRYPSVNSTQDDNIAAVWTYIQIRFIKHVSNSEAYIFI